MLFLFVFTAKFGQAQYPHMDYNSALKISNLTVFQERSGSLRFNTNPSYLEESANTSLQILQPTIAFQWKSEKGNFHEIELTSLSWGKVGAETVVTYDSTSSGIRVAASDLTTADISMRYEYILVFNKEKYSKVVPSVGFGVNPYFGNVRYSPEVSSSFPASETTVGIRTFITPRVTYFMTSRLFVDVNLPVCITDAGIFIDEVDDPAIPVDQRSISTFDFNQFPRFFSGRIGLGVKL
jgi:hypothetical protein